MTDEKENSVPKRPRARKRRFHQIRYNLSGRPGFWIADESVLPPYQVSRLPASTPPVPYMFDKSDGRPPGDLELCWGWWLISDRTKAVFERMDPEAFVFVRCDVRLPKGSYHGPDYWICDVVRVLDAVDEAQSHLQIGIRDDIRYMDHGMKYYEFPLGYKLVFREDVIGTAHIFRMAYNEATVICDQEFKDACKSAGLKKIHFADTSKGEI
ncbi:DUF1629 domain-containing protein [Bradyrhizobium sp. A11]|uniref:imm11 family protein n=1 Tax=Bradyrhizobium sp. A11 TaxID=3133974 RepID=UPI0032479BA7